MLSLVVVRKLSFQMDLDFDPAYNDINHEKFQEIDQAVSKYCEISAVS